ncbi:S-layer protein [Variibacter gotjawalensis]|uniref:S-layer protein n=1 Tax=Variibacter gotjawalensis TaxID=1333996 RepID=A0A0S3PNT1_9BRAD|nr:hypothetical protein [Variibacter gotjawalensis]NIK47868.1 hypothetical protein [Variibacter gotjawalensis]RZS49753.1 hypothetical protein EV661_2193 [Variibacter gotjawalensis]BAT57581.1 S-layer protein [Variibacter gotjawalensis]
MALGSIGSILNPVTGVLNPVTGVLNPVTGILDPVTGILDPVITPITDILDGILDPVTGGLLDGILPDILQPVGDILGGLTGGGGVLNLTDLLDDGLLDALKLTKLDGIDLSNLDLGVLGLKLGGNDNLIPEVKLTSGDVTLLDLVTELGSSRGLLVVDGKLLFQTAGDALIDLGLSVGKDGTLLDLIGLDLSLGDLITIIIGGGGGGDDDDPTVEQLALNEAYLNITRIDPTTSEAPADEVAALNTMANQMKNGTLTLDQAVAKIVDYADDGTSVANTAYQFFTGKTPTEAGVDYLVNSPDSINATDLNDAYYQHFNLENRAINFGVNLGKLGEGNAKFVADYGGLSLSQTVGKAYQEIFGVAADQNKINAILNDQVQNASGNGTTYARSEYFKYYGGDAIGTKAALVGWLMTEAVKADVGAYAIANEHFLTDLADGKAQFNVNLIGTYASAESGHIDYTS